MNEQYVGIQTVHVIIIILNLFVSLAKIVCGWLIQSMVMVADGFHSLADGLNNVMGMVGAYIAFRPQDEKHPYGHRKFETLITLAIGAVLLFLCVNVVRGAYLRFLHPVSPEANLTSFLVMLGTLMINIWVAAYESRKGKELKSDFLIADANHTLSDVYVSLSVLGTLVAVKLGFFWVDALTAVFIAALIAKAAGEILVLAVNVLCDAAVLDPKAIALAVNGVDGVRHCHEIRTRGRRDDIHVDLHVVVDPDMDIETAHQLSHLIDRLLKDTFPGVTDVQVHVEPCTDMAGSET